MKCALVASGGGLKAYAFHLGVLKALEGASFRRMRGDELRHNLVAPDERRIACYIGSSAGAFFGAACIFLESWEEMAQAIGLHGGKSRFSRGRVFFRHLSLFSPSRGVAGLFGAEGLAKMARGLVKTDDFRSVGPEFFVCATQLNGARKVVFGPRDSSVNGKYSRVIAYYDDVPISEALAASSCVPVLFRPYRVSRPRGGEDVEYIDGEVRETLSMHIAHECNVDLVVSSSVWMPYQYDEAYGSLSKRGLSAILNQVIAQSSEQKIDRFLYDVQRYQETLLALEDFGRFEGLTDEQIENLKGQVSLTLAYTPIDEIYVAPDRDDTEFNLLPSFSLSPAQLQMCIDRGHSRAQLALAAFNSRKQVLAQSEETSDALVSGGRG
jgi:predicted acylesterase/phospholipase RssA